MLECLAPGDLTVTPRPQETHPSATNGHRHMGEGGRHVVAMVTRWTEDPGTVSYMYTMVDREPTHTPCTGEPDTEGWGKGVREMGTSHITGLVTMVSRTGLSNTTPPPSHTHTQTYSTNSWSTVVSGYHANLAPFTPNYFSSHNYGGRKPWISRSSVCDLQTTAPEVTLLTYDKPWPDP